MAITNTVTAVIASRGVSGMGKVASVECDHRIGYYGIRYGADRKSEIPDCCNNFPGVCTSHLADDERLFHFLPPFLTQHSFLFEACCALQEIHKLVRHGW